MICVIGMKCCTPLQWCVSALNNAIILKEKKKKKLGKISEMQSSTEESERKHWIYDVCNICAIHAFYYFLFSCYHLEKVWTRPKVVLAVLDLLSA